MFQKSFKVIEAPTKTPFMSPVGIITKCIKAHIKGILGYTSLPGKVGLCVSVPLQKANEEYYVL